jgi:carboxymethylenebutenolidase
MALRDYLVGEVAEDLADGILSRRDALRRLGLLGLGAAAAAAVLAACGDDDDTAAGDGARDGTGGDAGTGSAPAPTSSGATGSTTPSGSGTTVDAEVHVEGPNGELRAAYAAPEAPDGAVLVIHENRGLTPHFFDLVGRFATAGYAALCVDLASEDGGTEALGEAATTAALGAASLDRLVGDLRAGIDELQRRVPGAAVGAVGFCFGGGMCWQLLQAGEARLAAVVPFYGPAPEDPDFSGSRAAVLAIYAGRDSRVNASRDRAVAALEAAGLEHEVVTFPGVDHAFFNDTGGRYDEAAATDAYRRVLDWFGRHLR